MFCENCGQQVTHGGRFCENCGAPLPAAVEQTAAPQPQEAYAGQPVPGEQQAFAPAEPPAPKKPMSKKAKMIILFSAIGAAVIAAALVVLFVVIIPMINKANEEANKLDITKYITVKLNGVDEDTNEVFDGAITGEFKLDYDKFIADQKLASDTDESDTALYNIGAYAEITAEKKSGEKNEADSELYFKNATKDDVFTVTVEWPNGEGDEDKRSRKEIAEQEKKYGVKFKTEKKSVELKLGDLVTAAGVTVKDSAKADILGYIKDNNLIYSEENSDGSYNVYIKEFEMTAGDFTISKPVYYSMSLDIADKNGDIVTYAYLEFDKNSDYCSSGEVLTLGYEGYYKDSAADEGVLLIGDPVEYTVNGKNQTEGTTAETESTQATSATKPTEKNSKITSSAASSDTESASSQEEEGLSLEDAKTCVDQLKSYLLDNVYDKDDKATTGDKVDVKNIYYIKDKDSSYSRIVFVYENGSAGYFRALETDPCGLSLNGGKLESDTVYLSPSDPASTLEEATKNNWYMSDTYSEFYNITKLM